MTLWAVLAAIPASAATGSQMDTIAERGEAATFNAEMEEGAIVQFLYPSATSDTRLIKGGLAGRVRHDSRKR
jgi:hypothetical protein